jgi:hypothetical protein
VKGEKATEQGQVSHNERPDHRFTPFLDTQLEMLQWKLTQRDRELHAAQDVIKAKVGSSSRPSPPSCVVFWAGYRAGTVATWWALPALPSPWFSGRMPAPIVHLFPPPSTLPLPPGRKGEDDEWQRKLDYAHEQQYVTLTSPSPSTNCHRPCAQAQRVAAPPIQHSAESRADPDGKSCSAQHALGTANEEGREDPL